MLKSQLIYDQASEIQKRCPTYDMLELARYLGITIYRREDFQELLGMYLNRWRMRMIFFNGRMEEDLARLVIAHEIGHDTLHRSLATGANGLQEFTLFDLRTITEYEANAFAAHLLLEDDAVYQLAKEGNDIQQLSRQLHVPINLALIKMQEMNKLGYDFRLSDTPRGDFLKNIHT